jgi:hypothetical protein
VKLDAFVSSGPKPVRLGEDPANALGGRAQQNALEQPREGSFMTRLRLANRDEDQFLVTHFKAQA